VVAGDHLSVVHATLSRLWQGLAEPPPDRWRMLFEIAVAEVAANIIEHAVPATMTMRLRLDERQVVAEFTDTGRGWSGPPAAERLLDEVAERGRGLALARTALDDMAYQRTGDVNHWRLVKRL
jgi:serine/threonine-protein kinase RsbW